MAVSGVGGGVAQRESRFEVGGLLDEAGGGGSARMRGSGVVFGTE